MPIFRGNFQGVGGGSLPDQRVFVEDCDAGRDKLCAISKVIKARTKRERMRSKIKTATKGKTAFVRTIWLMERLWRQRVRKNDVVWTRLKMFGGICIKFWKFSARLSADSVDF